MDTLHLEPFNYRGLRCHSLDGRSLVVYLALWSSKIVGCSAEPNLSKLRTQRPRQLLQLFNRREPSRANNALSNNLETIDGGCLSCGDTEQAFRNDGIVYAPVGGTLTSSTKNV